MIPSTSYQDAILRPGSSDIGVLFAARQEDLQKFLYRRLAKPVPSGTNYITQALFEGQEPRAPEDVLVRLPSLRQSKWKVTVLQKWVGRVEEVQADRFSAALVDATNSRNPIEQVEFDMREVSESDRSLLAVGATFYWSIGYRHTPGGQVERISSLRFARLPRLSELDVTRMFAEADQLAAFLERD